MEEIYGAVPRGRKIVGGKSKQSGCTGSSGSPLFTFRSFMNSRTVGIGDNASATDDVVHSTPCSKGEMVDRGCRDLSGDGDEDGAVRWFAYAIN